MTNDEKSDQADEQTVDSEDIPRQLDEDEDSEVLDKMKELEQDPPEKLEDWPDDDVKYQTFGGPEGHHGYDEGPERQLGPADVRFHEGGDVTVEGEKVDDPDEFKTDPIPGGPTDPNAAGGPEDEESSSDSE